MNRPLVIMGVCGSGKSTIAAQVAALLHRPFFDADAFHPPQNVEKMARGDALTDADRGPWLDRLAALLAHEPRAVLACSALKRAYRERLGGSAEAFFVHLDVDRDTLARRMRSRAAHFMPETLLDSQLDTLEVPGDEEPAAVVNGAHPLAAVVDQAVDAAVAAGAASRK